MSTKNVGTGVPESLLSADIAGDAPIARSRVRAAVRRQVLAAAMLAAGVAAPGFAADAAATDDAVEELQEVIVTGSRLQREGMSSPTPVTALSTDELLNVNPQSLAQGLAQLPSMSTSVVPGAVARVRSSAFAAWVRRAT
jgi:hypothetical protein